MVDVCFSIWRNEELTWAFQCDQTLAFGPWAEVPHNAEAVVSDLCTRTLTDHAWADNFGLDCLSDVVWVTVTAPAWVVGTYEVVMERVLCAEARKLPAGHGQPALPKEG